MFMSWASPRSIPGAFGLNRLANVRMGGSAADHNKHGSGFWSKFCYACAIVLLASILWIWAVVIHDIYKKTASFVSKTFYMVGATLVAIVLFMIIVYITMTFRPPRRPSTATANATAASAQSEHCIDTNDNEV